MDFDREYDLENAGIDAFDFSLMDDDERAEALRDAGLDPDDFDGVEFDSSFDAWSALQDNGLSLWELDLMDDDEKREALEEAGLDPDDYETLPAAYPVSYSAPSTPPVQQNTHPADNTGTYAAARSLLREGAQATTTPLALLSLRGDAAVTAVELPDNVEAQRAGNARHGEACQMVRGRHTRRGSGAGYGRRLLRTDSAPGHAPAPACCAPARERVCWTFVGQRALTWR